MTCWEEQFVGVLRTGVGNVGVTEGSAGLRCIIGQLIISLALIGTGIVGVHIWDSLLKVVVILSIVIG